MKNPDEQVFTVNARLHATPFAEQATHAPAVLK